MPTFLDSVESSRSAASAGPRQDPGEVMKRYWKAEEEVPGHAGRYSPRFRRGTEPFLLLMRHFGGPWFEISPSLGLVLGNCIDSA